MELKDLKWCEVIAMALFLSNGEAYSNTEISNCDIVRQYMKTKRNNSIANTISKTLNQYYQNSRDRTRKEPYLFTKNTKDKWELTEKGRELVEKVISKLKII